MSAFVKRLKAKVLWEVRTRRDPIRYLPMPSPDMGAVLADIHALALWMEGTDFRSSVEISVITATKSRRHLLDNAASSVLAQSHTQWQWCVVNDGPPGDLDEFNERWLDARVRIIEANDVGLTAARNMGLDAASGDLIVYLDDDNRFHREWLRSLAFAVEIGEWTWGYGARVLETIRPPASEDLYFPVVDFPLYLREQLKHFNYIDANAIFHRRQAWRFDENTRNHSDWELVLRLAQESDPLRLPAISALYATRHQDRMSLNPAERADRAYIRAKHSLPD